MCCHLSYRIPMVLSVLTALAVPILFLPVILSIVGCEHCLVMYSTPTGDYTSTIPSCEQTSSTVVKDTSGK